MRGLCAVFLENGESSFQSSVERVWKLCKKWFAAEGTV